MKITRTIRRVLKAIDCGEQWKATTDTVVAITDGGLAVLRGLEDVKDPRDVGWELTDAGREVVRGRIA